jgi:prolyl-tRNA synthetase
MAQKLTTRADNYSEWYNELVAKADLAEHSDVRGCMVIKPYGYAIWEKMKEVLDAKFKETGHSNAYFPIFIPKSLFEAEEKNAEGFAKECAVVTHHRLMNDPDNPGKLMVDPASKLTEELVVRPTSEAIIWSTYKKWIQSYRDLPILINQWANVVRWEMRTRIFLRTAEFLWQEGHTAHQTRQEALEETERMNNVYADFAEHYMAMPVSKGAKSDSERFAGADETYCIEAMRQEGKALQAGTSHFLGQNFAKAFDVKFTDKEGKQEFVWATSWGVSTRLMGALIMTHSDDEGLVLPPALAPIQVVAIPIHKKDEELEAITSKFKELEKELRSRGISFKLDDDENRRPGWKFAEYEAKGVPVRLAMGPRDLGNGAVEIARRDEKTKEIVSFDSAADYIESLLEEMQKGLFDKAVKFRADNTQKVDSYDDFKQKIKADGGFFLAHWDGTEETEQKIKDETKATIRCIPFDREEEIGVCMVTGKPSAGRVIFAKAY